MTGKYIIDETIMVKDKRNTAGSKMLEGFLSPFTATVVEELEKKGYELLKLQKTDEFGIAGIDGDFEEILPEGIAYLLDGRVDFILSNDFSGKQKRLAAENGLFYLHPTYGSVSRFGLIPSVSSMDQIGVMARTADDCFSILAKIAGHDDNDGTSLPVKTYTYSDSGCVKIGGIKNPYNAFNDVELKYLGILPDVFIILACAELSNNITRYDGVKFGYRTENYRNLNEIYLNSRTEGFGALAKLYAILGSAVLSKEYYWEYYDKAMRLRRLIKEEFEKALTDFDVLALPVGKNEEPYEESALYALAPLCGAPSLAFTMKSGERVVLFARQGNENALYAAAKGGAI